MRKDLVLPITIVIAIIAICVAYIFFPSQIYDNWIWKYYWGPVVADAVGKNVEYNGVVAHEGYTIISEITYGVIALVSLYYIYGLLQKLKVRINWDFCLSLIPFFVYGSVARVMEDAGCFDIPVAYFFISPLIYLQIAIIFIVSIVIEHLLRMKIQRKGKILIIPFAIGSIGSVSGGLLLLTSPNTSPFRFDIFGVCMFFPVIITFFIYLIGERINKMKVFSHPLNLCMIFGHTLDGFTSYISIYDPFGMGIPAYGEKHPLSFLLMDLSGGLLYPVVKIIIVLITIIVLEEIRKEESINEDVINLLRIAIFILGFSPGLRDLLRVSLSV